ncbi:sugar kinase [Roseomonas stagni]|uniref:Sugar kinase n=1 Tax=Falsiroseomonas algicola TaxID=2716930 RepID=A0A6M1LFE3_9PROT|nr:PfkB family carbohydrate kinase [Falsiroseomonas algicola]NGM18993.1 sugar kinase [Falsiroseomonas algicola]
MTAPRIACIGMAALDRTYRMPRLPPAPGKYVAAGYEDVGGGMAATASVAVARLGGDALWIGRTGDDPAGEWLRAGLAARGVRHLPELVAPGGITPNSAVLVDPEGERILAVFPGAGLVEVPRFTLEGVGAVMADPRWPDGAAHAFTQANAMGIPRVLDGEVAAGEALHRLAPMADHILFSERGLKEFTGIDDAAQGLATVAARFDAVLAVTLGAAGSLWWRDGAAHPLPAPRVQAVDTTGCGDVFHGAYALAIAEGAPVEHAARFATAAAALKAAAGSGWDAAPRRAPVQALLDTGW